MGSTCLVLPEMKRNRKAGKTMSFVDNIYSYQNSTASNTQTMNSVKDTGAVRSISAQAQELIPGKVFEGTVTDIKNGQVTIGLNDGRSISARMESGVNLQKGQPMIFEIKSVSQEQIAIRPITLESAQNPTLLHALEAAGLKVNDRNLSMVNQMMAEQLPINKSGLLQMMRLSASFPKADIQTLVQMQKLGIPVTEESLNQFQNYKNGQQAILPEMNRLMEGIVELPGQIFGAQGENAVSQAPGALLEFQQQILDILLGNGGQSAEAQVGDMQNQANANINATEGMLDNSNLAAKEAQTVIGNSTAEEVIGGQQSLSGENLVQQQESLPGAAQSQETVISSHSGDNSNSTQVNEALAQGQNMADGKATDVSGEGQNATVIKEGLTGERQSAGQILSREQQGRLTSLLQEFSGARANEQLLPNGRLNTNLSVGELLEQIMKSLQNSKDYNSASVQKLFFSKEYKGLMKQAMADQWLLTPEQLKEEGAVKEMYQRLSRQMTELQQTLSQAGKEGTALAKTAQSVQSNLDFMNQLNQVYTYVQIPLKLQNQNVHSDLYVYTNKKNLRDKQGELTALLHLDMDHLGSTDIFVKLMGTAVQTEFYFESEASCRLISGFSEELVKRLQEKGYSCEVKVENRKKTQDFVQDFLERKKPSAKMHRYSFDVKA